MKVKFRDIKTGNIVEKEFYSIKYPNYLFYNYYISKDGDVYNKKNNKMIKPIINGHGYCFINITTYNGYDAKRVFIHRLVAYTFIGNPPTNMKDPTVDHINRITTDNRVENLRWIEQCDNSSNCGIFTDEAVDDILSLYKNGVKLHVYNDDFIKF